MKGEIYFDAEQYSLLQAKVRGNFDNPKTDLKEAYGKLFFSGWIISETKDVLLKVRYSEQQTEIYFLNISRPDVTKYLNLSDEFQFCGFQFHVDLNISKTIEVSVSSDGIEYTIWKIKASDPDQQRIDKIKNFWEALHDPRITSTEDPSLEDAKILGSLFHLSNANEVYYSLQLKDSNNFEDEGDFHNLIQSFKNRYWAMDAVENSAINGTLIHSSHNGKVSFRCAGSYAIDDYNFILFSGIDFQFYLVQHCTNILIIFPALYKCVSLFTGDLATYAMGKISELFLTLSNLKKLGISFPRLSPALFDGLNVSHGRPYHFVYDYLHGLDYLSLTNMQLNSLAVSSFDFLELSQYFDNIKSFCSVEQFSLNRRSSSLGNFYLMPCLQYINGDHDRNLVSLSKNLREKNQRIFLRSRPIKKTFKKDYKLIFWVGVSIEKRSWIEQTEGLISIIDALYKKYRDVLILVDGRTSPLTNSSQPSSTIFERENEVFKKIRNSLPYVDFINLIGRTMSEKISYASSIDLFFSSYATDSMYPSCIQRKPGAVYVAPSIGERRSLHVHEDVIEVPAESVFEINSQGRAWHETSVSMSWKDVYSCIEALLNREV